MISIFFCNKITEIFMTKIYVTLIWRNTPGQCTSALSGLFLLGTYCYMLGYVIDIPLPHLAIFSTYYQYTCTNCRHACSSCRNICKLCRKQTLHSVLLWSVCQARQAVTDLICFLMHLDGWHGKQFTGGKKPRMK